jgi:hypothetical protein
MQPVEGLCADVDRHAGAERAHANVELVRATNKTSLQPRSPPTSRQIRVG